MGAGHGSRFLAGPIVAAGLSGRGDAVLRFGASGGAGHAPDQPFG